MLKQKMKTIQEREQLLNEMFEERQNIMPKKKQQPVDAKFQYKDTCIMNCYKFYND